MKWFILIVMTFAPPKPDYDSMVVTTKDNNLMIFGSYGKCYTYIHDNASILMKLGKKIVCNLIKGINLLFIKLFLVVPPV